MTGNPRACANCPSGKSSVYGQSVCQICVSGQYANADIEATSCEFCPTGQHGIANITIDKRINVNDACSNCGQGKYSLTTGVADSNGCTFCPPGKYSDE